MSDCEILCIGTELLLGQVLNTNSQFLSTELAGIGINCFYQTTVGDNKSRIIDSLKLALNRAQIVLITGGLGPTPDDLTTECVAETFDAELVYDAAVMERIESFFKTRGITMPESNRKQALRPVGASILPNPRGTAPGIIWTLHPADLEKAGVQRPEMKRIIMTFPGVPSEMQAMWKETASPFLVNEFGHTVLWSRELKHYGIGESALAEKYSHLLDMTNPTVAPYAGRGECRLRVTARGASVAEAIKIATPVIEEILAGSGTLCYGMDDDTLESVVGKLLTKRMLKMSVAESCTGGLISKRLTDVEGSSAYIGLNVVTYADEAKEKILGVSSSTIVQHGAVSERCAQEMADGMRKLSNADLALSVTGIAGPGGGTADKPVGLVYVGLADENNVRVVRLQFPAHLSRDEIRHRTASEALNMVRHQLLQMTNPAPANVS